MNWFDCMLCYSWLSVVICICLFFKLLIYFIKLQNSVSYLANSEKNIPFIKNWLLLRIHWGNVENVYFNIVLHYFQNTPVTLIPYSSFLRSWSTSVSFTFFGLPINWNILFFSTVSLAPKATPDLNASWVNEWKFYFSSISSKYINGPDILLFMCIWFCLVLDSNSSVTVLSWEKFMGWFF